MINLLIDIVNVLFRRNKKNSKVGIAVDIYTR